MKKTIQALFSVLMTFVMLFSCIAVFNTGVHASDDEPDYVANLYYFNDYYPTVPKSKMDEDYPEIATTYDHKWVDSDGFNSMIYNGYFDFIPANTIVVIDIKTFMVGSTQLSTLFSSLKDRNCKTIFVSVYSIQDYANDENEDTDFLEYVDQYVESNFERLRTFIELHLRRVKYNNVNYGASASFPYNDTLTLIDGRLLDIENCSDIDALCENSPFLRILLETIAAGYSVSNFTSYHNMFGELLDDHNIPIFAHMGSNGYIDIFTGETYEAETFEEFYEQVGKNSAYFCAIGFSHLESEFHDFLVDAQSFVRQDLMSYLPVDILEVEPFVPGNPVLDFMTDRQLIALYREEPHIEWDIFYDALDEILDEII